MEEEASADPALSSAQSTFVLPSPQPETPLFHRPTHAPLWHVCDTFSRLRWSLDGAVRTFMHSVALICFHCKVMFSSNRVEATPVTDFFSISCHGDDYVVAKATVPYQHCILSLYCCSCNNNEELQEIKHGCQSSRPK